MRNAIEGYRRRQRSGRWYEAPIADQRAAYEQIALKHPAPADIRVNQISMGSVSGELLTGESTTRPGALLYLHGGGYTACSPRTHRELAGRIGRATRVRVYVPDYRLAPEHPFPAALDDARAAYDFMREQSGLSHQALAVAGDSAGGGLALALLLSLRDEGAALPACACLMSPWTDLAVTGASIGTMAHEDPVCAVDHIRATAGLYAGKHDVRNPAVSPLYGDFTGLPPLLIQVGTRELILDDSTRVAERARAAGVDVTLEVEEGAIHVWQALSHVPEALAATDRVSSFIRHHCLLDARADHG